MESAVKGYAINGSPQKTAKPRDKMPGVAEPSFASDRSDRGETIEDIISELNATARTDAPAPEALGDATTDSNGGAHRDSLEQCDRKTESLASSPECIEDSGDELPTTRDEEADVAFAASEDARPDPEYVLPDPEYVLPDNQDSPPVYECAPPVSEVKDSDGAPLPQTTAGASQDTEETVEPASDELSQMQTQKISEPTPDGDASAITPTEEPKKSDQVPNDAEGSLERSDGGIKVPDETIQSPRRTSRQRVASQKLIESSQNVKPRQGSGTPDVSSAESSPVKQSGSLRLVSSDSDSDAPLARRVRKLSGNQRPVTSDSDSDVPIAQRKRKASAAEGQEDSGVVKRLSFVRKAKDTAQVKKTSPAKPAESQRKKGSVTNALTQNGESKEADGESLQEPPKASENTTTPKKTGSAKKKSTPAPANKGKSTPTSANKSKRKSAQPEIPDSVDSTGIESSSHQDGDAPSAAPKSKKAKGKASMPEVTPADSHVQGSSELNDLPKPKKAKGKMVKAAPTPISSPASEQSTPASKPKKKKMVIPVSPGNPTKDRNEVAAVPSPKKGKRKVERPVTSPEDQAEFSTANEENEQPTTSKRRSGTAAAAAGENNQPAVPKRQQRESVADGSDAGQSSSAAPLQAANRIGASSVQRRVDRASFPSPQTTTSQSAEPSDVVLWSSPQFTEYDHLLHETIQVSLKGQQPVAGSSYLTIEVPSANVRRSWGPAVARRRPTVVLGGCDPNTMYVNLAGTRVPLQQWQHVSKITPTIRLTDIFKTFRPA
ncbi:uncharacterized protein LOC144145296 [Haemaphysalis longicornis]